MLSFSTAQRKRSNGATLLEFMGYYIWSIIYLIAAFTNRSHCRHFRKQVRSPFRAANSSCEPSASSTPVEQIYIHDTSHLTVNKNQHPICLLKQPLYILVLHIIDNVLVNLVFQGM